MNHAKDLFSQVSCTCIPWWHLLLRRRDGIFGRRYSSTFHEDTFTVLLTADIQFHSFLPSIVWPRPLSKTQSPEVSSPIFNKVLHSKELSSTDSTATLTCCTLPKHCSTSHQKNWQRSFCVYYLRSVWRAWQWIQRQVVSTKPTTSRFSISSSCG